MGLKDDRQHEDWRKEHGLPDEIAFGRVSKMRFEIFIAMGKDRNLFNPEKK